MRASISLVTFFSLSLLASHLPARAQNQDAAPVAAPVVAPGIGAPAAQPGGALAGDVEPNPEQPAKTSTLTERNATARAQYEMRLRAMMTDFGIEAAASQDAVIAYLAEDEAGRRGVRSAARRMMIAVRGAAAPERLRESIAVYKSAIDADRERRRAAQNSLDAKIGFSLSPRLEATLWILGVLGEGQTGLPLAVLAPRTSKIVMGDGAHAGTHEGTLDGKQDVPRDEKREGARRGGTVTGVVTRKAQGWIEVRAEGGQTDRYLPFWAGGEPPLNPIPGTPASKDEWARLNSNTLKTLAGVKIGDRVRLDWVWSERKRVLRLEVLATDPALTAPATDAPPAPAYPVPAHPDVGP